MQENVDQFFRPDGSLIRIPVKATKKIAGLHRIAKTFSPNAKYSEKTLNEVIEAFHPDSAAIRRHMIEYGIMERDAASIYWVAANSRV